MKISIADGRGALWQWDTGRRLRVGSGVEQIHYQNKCFGRSVDVDVGDDGTAIIPDELLQDCHTLTAYAYVTDDTGAYTMVQQDFVVHKRAKRYLGYHNPTVIRITNFRVLILASAQMRKPVAGTKRRGRARLTT